MKNFISVSNKLLVGIITVTAAVSIAAPASADTTTAGYYDQFGNFHMYQVYTPPTSYYSGGNVYYGNSVNQYSQYNRSYYGGSSYDSEYGVRVVRPGTSVVTQTSSYDAVRVSSASNYGYSNTNTSNLSVGKSATTADNSAYTGSAVTSLFGGKKAAGKLEITNIVVTSGPLNIYNDKTEVNCDVTVSWNSGVPTAGQVVYGTVSQPKIDSFSYQATAPESNSLETSHSVKLGCLDNATYYFRIVAFSAKERVVSDEQIIFPIKIRTQIPVVGASKDSGNGASVLATLGKITTNPFVLIVLLGVIAYLIATRMSRKGGGHAAHAEPAHAEPSLLIPHH
jgi:hypothetical protein